MSAGPRPALRGDIEGLRAVAVLLVLLYHVGFSPLSGGFAGVDAFFVISGFLITSHLIKEVEATGRIDLVRFYARRARRLLPAATVVLLFTAVAGYLVVPRVELTNLASDIAAAALYVVNWTLAWRSVDYLAEDAAVSPLQHYWSLSVEEQFYLVWPLLILLALALTARRVRPRVVVGVAVTVVAVASLTWSALYTAADPQMAFFVTTTRMWELGAGALVAAALPVLRRLPRLLSEVLAWTGVLLLAYTAVGVDAATPWPGTAALLPVLGTAAVIIAGCAHPGTTAGRLLAVRPMQWVGGASYAIYLWHWPLIILAQNRWPNLSPAAVVLIGAASIPLAWVTRRYVEDPIRFGPRLTRRPARALAVGAAGMVLSVTAAGAVYASVPRATEAPDTAPGALALVADPETEGVPEIIDDPEETFTSAGPVTPDPVRAREDIPRYYDDGCQASPEQTTPMLDCVYGVPDGETTVAVVGDSKMGQWLPALEAIAEREDWRLELYLKSGCGFYPVGQYDECLVWNENVAEHLLGEEDAVDLVLASQGNSTIEDMFEPLAPDTEIVAGMAELWSALEERGARVVALEDNPKPNLTVLPDDARSVYECVAAHPEDYAACHIPRNNGGGTPALRAAAEETGAALVALNPWVCPGEGTCPPVIGDVLVYRQGSHITATYISSLAPVLHRELAALGLADGELLPLDPES